MAKKNDTRFLENKLLDFVAAKDPLLEMLQWMMDKFMEIEVARKTGAPKGSHSQGRTGPYADELARSLHTLALVLGTDIFFRNGAYRPETEEGRKILAHELTHVAQNKECKPDDNRTRKELEREAEAAEKTAEDSGDPLIARRIGKKYYSFTQKEWNQINKNVKTMIEDWIESEERNMTEREYLDFLYKIQEMEIMERKCMLNGQSIATEDFFTADCGFLKAGLKVLC